MNAFKLRQQDNAFLFVWVGAGDERGDRFGLTGIVRQSQAELNAPFWRQKSNVEKTTFSSCLGRLVDMGSALVVALRYS
jgi:hypothetical protein